MWAAVCSFANAPMRECARLKLLAKKKPQKWEILNIKTQCVRDLRVCSFSYLFVPLSNYGSMKNDYKKTHSVNYFGHLQCVGGTVSSLSYCVANCHQPTLAWGDTFSISIFKLHLYTWPKVWQRKCKHFSMPGCFFYNPRHKTVEQNKQHVECLAIIEAFQLVRLKM